MMKKHLTLTIRHIIFFALSFILSACTNGQIDSSKALAQMHIVKSDDYKKCPAGLALVQVLAMMIVQTYRSGGKSLIKWDGPTCDTKAVIDSINKNPQFIPVFYMRIMSMVRSGHNVVRFQVED
jgi:hypothetical protein